MQITAIIIDGRHGGTAMVIEYNPKITLPITKESQISFGESYDQSVRIGDSVEYKECYRSVDKGCVLYSEKGRWSDIKYGVSIFRPTYPIHI